MADKKISQLTAATTPLAGTEVLPIVQSAVTKQVSVADLTVNRAVTAASLTVNGTVSGQGGSFIRNGANGGLVVTAAAGTFSVNTNSLARFSIANDGEISAVTGNFNFTAAGKGLVFVGNNSVIWRTGAGSPEGAVTAPVGSLYTRTDGGANTTLYVKESGAGNTGWVAK